ncbi:FecR domain-containing protein, partial [Anabaena sp. CCY 0017]|uniref:FecR domain-containing protein n=1 Tax=Anabaena sp. CCY 0017 TaxID=3103866 RepID=UPI0039C75404
MTPLTRAEIQNLRNIVQLIPLRQRQRPARRADPMNPGDRLSTGRASLADLRFNDGSLARVGEQAVFRFLPQSRNFTLSNGTMLLLIPPGRGKTRIQTPNAAAAIRGSALFVRYDEKTDTTVVGALTNSGIEVFNQKASQNQLLEAGQLMVIVKGEFQGLYDFDLRTFYETSDLVRGLNLDQLDIDDTSDRAIASVKAEITTAVAKQLPVNGEKVIENPSFLQLSPRSSDSANQDVNRDISPPQTIDNFPADTLVEAGETFSDTISEPENINNTPPDIEDNTPPDVEDNTPPDVEDNTPPDVEDNTP